MTRESQGQGSAIQPPARESFGTGRDGETVYRYHLSNAAGMAVAIMGYGASINQVVVPDGEGVPRSVVLGFPKLADYLAPHPRLGAIMGRYGNRIGGARFELDGREYHLTVNEGKNTIHGGNRGFDRWTWREVELGHGPEGSRVVLEHRSPKGEEGFPGTVTVRVMYTVTPASELCIDYFATTDEPTVLNLTNHAYFNLSGEGSGNIFDHELVIFADSFTPVGHDLLPTGEIHDVTGTPFDFRIATPIGARIRQGHEQLVRGKGYDHNYVLNKPSGAAAEQPVHAARLRSPKTGIVMDTYTTEPGVQLHTGNVLTGAHVGHSGSTYRQSDGVCLETQKFPDTPNRPNFPSCVLRPGAPLESRTIYQFRTS
ncbi:aldose epimerase family protein [Pendulispora albinea]|uniref:Aldose 1-epimerase n=1 Tax=Pendulispora albinea TaxID=2741071 RepID=A0ABZ2M5Y1_9BACT